MSYGVVVSSFPGTDIFCIKIRKQGYPFWFRNPSESSQKVILRMNTIIIFVETILI